MSIKDQLSDRRGRVAVAIAAGAVVAAIGSAAPAYADDFNPQPDPPHASLDVNVAVSGLSACTIRLWPPGPTYPPGPSTSVQPLLSLTVPLAGIFPPDPCAPAPR
jgi:hypothetical protein